MIREGPSLMKSLASVPDVPVTGVQLPPGGMGYRKPSEYLTGEVSVFALTMETKQPLEFKDSPQPHFLDGERSKLVSITWAGYRSIVDLMESRVPAIEESDF